MVQMHFQYKIMNQNKDYDNKINEDGKQSPLFQELTPYQYVGLLLIVFGIAPFLQHFISSIFLGAGLEVGENLVEQFTE